jgi:general secretion pathway protein M
MIAALKNWWAGLAPRERVLVGIAGALTFAVLLWLLLRPIAAYMSGLGEAHRVAVERAARVDTKVALIKKAGDRPVGASHAGPLDQWLAQSATDTGLTLDRNEPRGGDAATIAISSARAPALIGWLAGLEGQGLVVDRLSLTPGTDGSVALTAEVRRP